ncbi:Polysaccharide deacetylase [uncultured delta proteobacterium]|uniref:Polysaccharide deacetylase n=1 Tax=uncultured delta proteobacterium TaxID=34034 RepID=A0A212ITV8_9DELT|nr:Polysaccharide deacetylase [uncultured delta proteobacterium]
MPKKTTSLPVLMYHYISRYPNSIAVSPDLFAAHCESLVNHGWRGVSLAEAEAYFLHGEDLPPKSCLITFDDGYLDNYVYAWPILQQCGHKGVIFAVSSKIEPSGPLRTTLGDVRRGTVAANALPRVDEPFVPHPNGYDMRADLFFNWAEAREMEKSGVIAVASHTFGHQGVFINNDYDGFFLPERRGRTFHDPEPFFWGAPKFVMGPGLLERAFLPDPELAAKIRNLVPQDEQGAFAFAEDSANMRELKELVASNAALGRMETDEEMAARMDREIRNGKEVLEKELGHPVTSLCWPWGAYSPLALEIGRQAGFTVFFTTKAGPNPPLSPLAVCRFKAKDKNASWLLNRVRLYASPLLARLYAGLQLRTPGKNTGKRKSFVIRQR